MSVTDDLLVATTNSPFEPPSRTPGREPTVADAMTPPGGFVSGGARVERVLDLFHESGGDHLLIQTRDGRCAGLVTLAQLGPYRTRSWYTARTFLRDIVYDRGPFAAPEMSLAAASRTMRARSLRAWPVTDADGVSVGILTLAGLRAALGATTASLVPMSVSASVSSSTAAAA